MYVNSSSESQGRGLVGSGKNAEKVFKSGWGSLCGILLAMDQFHDLFEWLPVIVWCRPVRVQHLSHCFQLDCFLDAREKLPPVF